MRSFIFELDVRGLNELMKSDEMKAVVNDAAHKIASRAGYGFKANEARGLSFDAICSVVAASKAGQSRQLKDNVLEKAMRGVKV